MNPTAAIVIIGNEILSGRTQDINIQYLAQKLSEIGIQLKEIRIIPDHKQTIIEVISSIKSKYDYIFTTGGIGPTHDDITSDAIAAAFNLPLELNQEAYNLLKACYEKHNKPLNAAREKMAYIPRGGVLIDNPVSTAPGFIIENIYVLAGVPHIMQAMFNGIVEKLEHGTKITSKQVDVMIGESTIAMDFAWLQDKYPEVEMGSYPFETKDNKHGTSLVLRSVDTKSLEKSFGELLAILEKY